MLMPTPLTKLLADFCCDYRLHARFPDSAMRTAELAITDTVACILGGVDDPAAVKLGTRRAVGSIEKIDLGPPSFPK